MATKISGTYELKPIAPLRSDPPGTVTKMPSPRELHHVHIFSDQNYDAMVEFYQMLFNGGVTNVHKHDAGGELDALLGLATARHQPATGAVGAAQLGVIVLAAGAGVAVARRDLHLPHRRCPPP